MIGEICRYPCKGLCAEVLETALLSPGRGIEGDRKFAVALAGGDFDDDRPGHLPKTNFAMLMRDQALATLRTCFDDRNHCLRVRPANGGKEQIYDLADDASVRTFCRMLEALLPDLAAKSGPFRLVSATGFMFSDVARPCVSIVNRASVTALADALGQPLDGRRFRANILLDNLPPWAEFDWLDREITIGGARARVFSRIVRCAATNVNPANGQRDLNLPKALMRHFGHADMGIYAEIIEGGVARHGDRVGPAADRR